MLYVPLQVERALIQVNPEGIKANQAIGIDVEVAKAVSCSKTTSFEYHNKQSNSSQLAA
jgi:hypothetical protein